MYLLEVARALMFSMHVPKYLWGDAVLTTTYLINRMPTKVLNIRTPLNHFKEFFPTARLFSSLPIKVFGCIVYVHSPTPALTKLDPRAVKCIVVGCLP